MKKRLILLCSIALIAALSISLFATGVFATDSSSSSDTGSKTKFERRNHQMSAENLKKILDKLVSDGKITQAAADQAYALATAADASKADFSKLPQAVKDALKASMKEKMPGKFNSAETLKKMLDKLVSDGKITQAAADEAYALATVADASKADFSKLPQAVKDALKASMKEKMPGKFNSAEALKKMLDKLVSDGKITQVVADEGYALATAADATKADFSKLPQAVKDALKASMPKMNKQPFAKGRNCSASKVATVS